MEVYSESDIRNNLHTKALAGRVVFYESTGSTNDDCKRLMEERAGSDESILVAAANQERGKGRRGRSWSSPVGSSISFSLGLPLQIPPQSASMLTLVMALAVERAIRSATGLAPMIKWPNDIVVNGRKVCGILTELHYPKSENGFLVIGVGINVSQTEFAPEIRDIATSLMRELPTTGDATERTSVCRAALTAECVNQFEALYEIFCKSGDLSGLKSAYEEVLVNKGRQVRVLDPKGDYDAKAIGISDTGELLTETEDGKRQSVYAGEVSVRGLYDYV